MDNFFRGSSKDKPERLTTPYLIGNSSEIADIRKDIEKVGNTDLTVLILGETGTGKGLLASSLHNNSVRKSRPFVSINCANIPNHLMESELFGYKRGAFTGAWKDKIGKFELAANGTIFLDEISEMTTSMQAKLLQVLQDGKFSPVGGLDTIQVNVRFISATNSDLGHLISTNRFRLDLYYRLAVLCFYVPPLKNRKEDIIPLTKYFIDKYSTYYDKKTISPTLKMYNYLQNYNWPGNVRELENTIKTLVVLENEDMVINEMENKIIKEGNISTRNDKIEDGAFSSCRGPMTLKQYVDMERECAEKKIIREVLRKTNGNKKKTAELLQVSYKCILNKVKNYGL